MAVTYGNPYGSAYGSAYADPYPSPGGPTDALLKKIARLNKYGYSAEPDRSFLEKTLNLKPNSSILEKLLDLLPRSESASALLVGGLAKNEDLGTIASNVVESLKGQKKLTYTDLLKEMGMPDTTGTKILGFGLGTALDPLSWLPIGKLAGGVGKLGRKLPGVKNVMGFGDDVVKAAKEAVGIKTLTKGAKDTDTILKGITSRTNFEAMANIKKYNSMFSGLIEIDKKQMDLVRKALDLQKKIQPGLKERSTEKILANYLKRMDDSGLNLYGEINKMFRETGIAKKGAGIVDELIEGYLPHLATDEWKRKAIELGSKPGDTIELLRGMSRRNVAKIEKKRGLLGTIDYLNELSQKQFKVDMFESDLKEILPKYLYNFSRNMAVVDMNKELLKLTDEFGKPLIRRFTGKKVPVGLNKLTGLPYKGDYVTTPEISQLINRTMGVLSSDASLNKIVKVFDKAEKIWKFSVTAPNLGFHLNNLLGGLFNNFIYDAKSMSPATINKVEALLGKHPEAVKLVSKTGKRMNGLEFIQYMKKHGALTTFLTPEQALKPGFGQKVSEGFGGGIERIVRTQLALSQWEKNGKLLDAVRAVWRVHGNYAPEALSTFEREGVRRVLPFYVWAKTNIPFQIKGLMNQTGKYSALARAQNQRVSPEERATLPTWLRGEAITSVTDQPGGMKKVLPLSLPIGDLNDITSLRRLVGSRLFPAFKAPIEIMANRNLFYDKELFNKDLPASMQKATAPDAAQYLPPALKKLIGYQESSKVNKASGRTIPKREMDAQLAYILDQLGPLRRYANLTKTSTEIGPELGWEQNNLNTVLGSMFGFINALPPRYFHPKEQAESDRQRQLNLLQERINYLLQRKLIPELK